MLKVCTLAILFQLPLGAATLCVSVSGSGAADGSDWNNTLPQTFTAVRGNTYYYADGTYNGKTFSTAASGTTRITIKKATASDHGTETGWDSTYGDGVATFTGKVNVSTGYWTLDGQTGGGPSSWTSGFGFKILVTGATACFTPVGTGIIVQHFEMQGNGGDGDGGAQNNDIISIGSAAANDFQLRYCYLYDAGRCIIFDNQSTSGAIIEYCYTGAHESTAGEHSEIMSIGPASSGWAIRWNLFTYSEGTGGILIDGNGLEVYGNVFAPVNGGSLGGGNCLVGTWSADDATNLKIYNNTFISSGVRAFGLFSSGDTGEIKNNLIYNMDVGETYIDFFTHTHNHYVSITDGPITEATQTTASGDPFTSWATLDFSLASNTTAGTDLGPPYNVDMLGNTRTTWTRGAIEFTEGGGTSGGGGAAISISGTITIGGGVTLQ